MGRVLGAFKPRPDPSFTGGLKHSVPVPMLTLPWMEVRIPRRWGTQR